MAEIDQRGRLVKLVTALHRAAMLSLGYLAALIGLGGPFGLIPATAALLEEARDWQAWDQMRPGTFPRVFGRARLFWRRALPWSLLALGAGAALGGGVLLGTSLSVALAVVGAVWLLLAAQHVAFLLSLGYSPWHGGWRGFLVSAWLHLLAASLWIITLFGLFLPVMPLVLVFGPAAIGLILVSLEERPRALIGLLTGTDHKV